MSFDSTDGMRDPVWVILLIDRERIGGAIKLLRMDDIKGPVPTELPGLAQRFPTLSASRREIVLMTEYTGTMVYNRRAYLMVPVPIERPERECCPVLAAEMEQH